jgi:uncharacterized MAPEG superfamily protein
MHDTFFSYSVTLGGLAALGAISAAQGMIGGVIKNAVSGQPAGQPVAGDMRSFAFRAVRTHQNGVENLPAFFAVTLAAVLIGVATPTLAWLTVAVLITRVFYWVVYYLGIGTERFCARSLLYVVTPLVTLVIGVLSLLTLCASQS